MISSKKIYVDQPLLQVGCTLGEGDHSLLPDMLEIHPKAGPLYDARTNTLHFVDIVEKKVQWLIIITVLLLTNPQVYHLDTESLGLEVKKYDESVTCLALRRDKPGVCCRIC